MQKPEPKLLFAPPSTITTPEAAVPGKSPLLPFSEAQPSSESSHEAKPLLLAAVQEAIPDSAAGEKVRKQETIAALTPEQKSPQSTAAHSSSLTTLAMDLQKELAGKKTGGAKRPAPASPQMESMDKNLKPRSDMVLGKAVLAAVGLQRHLRGKQSSAAYEQPLSKPSVKRSKKSAHRPRLVSKSSSKKRCCESKTERQSLLASLPANLKKRWAEGCSKCRYRAYCTVSCWKLRGFPVYS